MKKVIIAISLQLGIFILLSSSSQTRSLFQPGTQSPTLRLSTELVTLDAQVMTKSSRRIVNGLQREDFIITEDGTKQKISFFSHGELPLSVILLLDISGSVGVINEQLIKGAQLSLALLRPKDEAALMVFSTEAILVEGFTQNRKLIEDKISKPIDLWNTLKDNLKDPYADGTHIGDSVYQASEYASRSATPLGRRVIIAITDNQPAGKRFLYSQKEVLNQLDESGVVVFGLIIDPFYKIVYKRKRPAIIKYNPNMWIIDGIDKLSRMIADRRAGGAIDVHASHTGGLAIRANKQNVPERLTELIDFIRHRYSLGYLPTNQQMDGKFRTIKLKVVPDVERREGKIVILAKRGYYARQRGKTNSPAQ